MALRVASQRCANIMTGRTTGGSRLGGVIIHFTNPKSPILGKRVVVASASVGNERYFFGGNQSNETKKKDNEEEVVEEPKGFLARTQNQILTSVLTPQNQMYALMGAGTIGAYFVTRSVLSFTSFFTHLTPTTIAKWGFFTGFGTASVLGVVGLVTMDNLYIRADPVYQYCSKWVMNDARVQKALGDGLQPGHLRSYRLDSGRLELNKKKSKDGSGGDGSYVTWRPPRIQMIFDVTATGPPYRTGLVTCEAVKTISSESSSSSSRWYKLPRLHTTLLKVDYETGDEHKGGTTEGDETIFLVGNEQDMSRVSSRSGLSLEMLARSVHINRGASRK